MRTQRPDAYGLPPVRANGFSGVHHLLALLAFIAPAAVQAQSPPDFPAAGIVSGADNSAAALGLARSSLFTIYGLRLAAATAQGSGSDLPLVLEGTRVRFRSAGIEMDAPLWYVSPSQINGVVPGDLPAGQAAVSVLTAAGESESRPVEIVERRFAAFTTSGRPFGPAIIQQYRGPAITLNRLTNPALPGDALVLWGTGLGGAIRDDVSVYLHGIAVLPFYAGPTPGLPGVDQINFVVPQGVTSRCFVPFVVRTGATDSGEYTLSAGPGVCPIEFAVSPSALECLDSGGVVRMTVLTVQADPAGSGMPQRAEAWVGEYDAAHLSVLANFDHDRSPAAFHCTRRGYSFDRWNRPASALGLPPELYGIHRVDGRLQVAVTGPAGCAWPFAVSADGIYESTAPPGCPAESYSIRDPLSIASASGRIPLGNPLPPMPSIEIIRRDDGADVTWRDAYGARLTVELSSSFTLPGNIFNGLTTVRELSCRLAGFSGAGSIPGPDLAWALGLPSSQSLAAGLALTSHIGGSWSSPSGALLIRTTELIEQPLTIH